MNQLRLAGAAAFALLLGHSATATAGCDFNVAEARGVRADMVRAFQACPGTEIPGVGLSITSAEGGAPACTPVVPAGGIGCGQEGCGLMEGSLYSFSAKGGCTVSATANVVADCSTLRGRDGTPLHLDANPCHVTTVSGKCRGVLGTDGWPVGNSDYGFELFTLTRVSLEDRTGGDMTVLDFPVQFRFDAPKNGTLRLRGNSAEALVPLLGASNADIPPCANLEFVLFQIRDPAGRVFAVPGGATRP